MYVREMCSLSVVVAVARGDEHPSPEMRLVEAKNYQLTTQQWPSLAEKELWRLGYSVLSLVRPRPFGSPGVQRTHQFGSACAERPASPPGVVGTGLLGQPWDGRRFRGHNEDGKPFPRDLKPFMMRPSWQRLLSWSVEPEHDVASTSTPTPPPLTMVRHQQESDSVYTTT
jgi:hypothetical protein